MTIHGDGSRHMPQRPAWRLFQAAMCSNACAAPIVMNIASMSMVTSETQDRIRVKGGSRCLV
jgi:hypothetical protein